jgi:lycopene cyclase domain-containing protein
MTFLGFLLVCMLPPVLVLLWVQRERVRASYLAITLVVGVGSIFYTAGWDSWLIEHNVWWFDLSRTLGIRFGVFPLEEALFYVLIAALGGLWTHVVFTRFAPDLGSAPRRPTLRWGSAAAVAGLWAVDVAVLIFVVPHWPIVTFFAQCVLVTLPALALLLGLVGDLLWYRRRYIALSVVVPALWLSVMAGTFTFGTELWVVNPKDSFGKLFGMIPAEMPIFYLLASALIAFPLNVLLQYDSEYFEGTVIGRSRIAKLSAP